MIGMFQPINFGNRRESGGGLVTIHDRLGWASRLEKGADGSGGVLERKPA